MNWQQPVAAQAERVSVSICETQPLVIEGLRACLAASRTLTLGAATRSLEEGARVVMTASPRIMVVDKAFGSPTVLEWVARMTEVCSRTAVVVWGNSMTESEALRFLKMGAKGIMRKTAEVSSILSCLENVAAGSTWMEETLFREVSQAERKTRHDLTPREQQVLELVEQGMRNKEIGRELSIRPGTVKIHLKHIFEKTGVRGRYGLALSGLRSKTAASIHAVNGERSELLF